MPAQTERLFTVWYRSSDDGRDHAVTDEEFYQTRQAGTGIAEGVCGHRVLLSPCIVPPGQQCPRCFTFLRARSTLPDLTERLGAPRQRHRKPSRFRRFLPFQSSRPTREHHFQRGAAGA